ncbi:MAG: SpoIIE family protein phosphatase, partial [Nitratireductor sp.]
VEPVTLQLARGERLLMATDGFAPDSADMLDGMPKAIARVLRESPGLPIGELSQRLSATLLDLLGPYPADDWTFVLIERSDFNPANS